MSIRRDHEFREASCGGIREVDRSAAGDADVDGRPICRIVDHEAVALDG
jgi:hypothetical protein